MDILQNKARADRFLFARSRGALFSLFAQIKRAPPASGGRARRSLCLVASLENLRGKGGKVTAFTQPALTTSRFAVAPPDPQTQAFMIEKILSSWPKSPS